MTLSYNCLAMPQSVTDCRTPGGTPLSILKNRGDYLGALAVGEAVE
jgi:hypothetical protein